MPIQLPDLYTKTYKDISDEMLASIPKYTDKWTNYNPSDPGITILELLSWIAENTLYRINRMSEESYIEFLRLVAGASGAYEVDRLLKDPDLDGNHRKILEFLKQIEDGNKKDVPEIKAMALTFVSSRYRAVTEEDFRELAIEATDSDQLDAKVKRAIVYKLPDEEKIEIVIVAVYKLPDEENTEIVILPEKWENQQDSTSGEKKHAQYKELIDYVTKYLDPRRLIGTIIEVKEPDYTPVKIDIKIILQPYARAEKVMGNVKSRIENYLHPLTGGAKGKGWPYNRPLIVYEIAQIIEETEGVERTVSVLFDEKTLTTKEIDGLIVSTVNVKVMEEEE